MTCCFIILMVLSTIPWDIDLGKISQSQEVSQCIRGFAARAIRGGARRAIGDGPGALVRGNAADNMNATRKDIPINISLDMSAYLEEKIFNSLQSSSPECDILCSELGKILGLCREDAGKFLYRIVAELNLRLFPPITQLELILTEACNLRCEYCFEADMIGSRQMPIEIAESAVDLLFDYCGDKTDLSITLFGGEPTLTFEAVTRVAKYAEIKASELEKCVHLNMTSNGVLLIDSVVARLAEHKIHVLLSIDGLQTSHDRFRVDKGGQGTFDRVKQGLQRLKKVQPWIGVKMTVMPQNVTRLFDDVKGLYDLGVNQFIIGHATGIRWTEEDMQAYIYKRHRLYKWYKETSRADLQINEFEKNIIDKSYYGCQAGRFSISVSVDGEISPCSKVLALNKMNLLAKLGDVKHGLYHLNNRMELTTCRQLRGAWEDMGNSDIYQGGCFADNYEEHKDLFRPSLQEHQFSVLKQSFVFCGEK